jgi:hypothetical protein
MVVVGTRRLTAKRNEEEEEESGLDTVFHFLTLIMLRSSKNVNYKGKQVV